MSAHASFDTTASVPGLRLVELDDCASLPRDAWNALVRESRASILFDTAILGALHAHSAEHPTAFRNFAIFDHDGLVAAAAAYCIQRSVWWSYYEVVTGGPEIFHGPWIAMPSVIAWSGDFPLRPGSDPVAVARLLADAGLRFARQQGAVALGLINVGRDWPLTAPFRALADVPVFLDNNAILFTHHDFDAYLGSLRSEARIRFKRMHRRAIDGGCELHAYAPAEYPPAILARLHAMFNGAATRRDHDQAYSEELVAALAATPYARLFVLTTADDTPISAFLVQETDETLYIQCGGWDPDHKDLHPFVTLLYEVISWAHAHHKKSIEGGRANYRFKRKYGFQFSQLHGLFFLTEGADAGQRERLANLDRGMRAYVAAEGGDASP